MISHTRLVAVLGATGLAFFMHGGLYAQAAAKPNADEQAVLTVNDRLEAAVLASDTATFRQVFAPEYLFITATGAVRPRDEVLRYYGAKESPGGSIGRTVYAFDCSVTRPWSRLWA